MKVYTIKIDDNGSDDYTDEDFIKYGKCYTLAEFQDAFNYGELINQDVYIRFINN